MALAATNLVTNSSGANQASYVTASVSPGSGLILLAVGSELSGAPQVPSISGNSLTWVPVVDCYFDQTGTAQRLSLFRAMGAAAAGVTTIDFAGIVQAGCEWSMIEVTGVDTSGTNGSGAIAQIAKTAEPFVGTATSITVTLANPLASGNAIISFANWQGNGAGTEEAGWTLLGQTTHAGPSAALLTQWLNSSADQSATTTWITSTPAGAIAIELQLAPAAGGSGALLSDRRNRLVGVL